MTNRDDRIDARLTPAERAELLLGNWNFDHGKMIQPLDRVGYVAATIGDLYDTPTDQFIQGLLTLLVTDFRDFVQDYHSADDDVPLELHRMWMRYHREKAIRNREQFHKEHSRISQFAAIDEFPGLSVFKCPPLGSYDYRKRAHRAEDRLIRDLTQFPRVRCIDDLIILRGIGTATLHKIRIATLKRDEAPE